ncbi:serine/threonine-protein kinase STK11-like [Oppia nitens]|uniref:serine/threonine-protein kinase STK11-like n=1 Tax=Oppia nitens TaxID=1686743 RepID=UPI0023DA0730|nr:serine/threonine-protein kinase STK11-like [Oppia nitens]
MTDIIIMNTDVKTVKYKEYDDYIKGEVLGEGTFAKVREFVHKLTIKRCAAKIFKRDRMSYLKKYKHNIYDNINNEIKLVYKLNHKNIIKFYDVLETNKKIYIFMEYCVGPLSDIIQSAFPNGLPKWQCHHYFCQLIVRIRQSFGRVCFYC